ncbi:MAG: amino acid racemase [Spirochaetes bacterium]|nr:amino acid racemase [Spirochaetota bacterium]
MRIIGILVATNTMHLFAQEIEAAAGLPLLHIADAAARVVKEAGAKRVGLLGTALTMENGFYADRLRERHGIETIVPDGTGRREVDRIIFDELCRGIFSDASRGRLPAVASGLADAGAEGVILGCTELPLAMKEGDAPFPLWDTTRLHAVAAAEFVTGSASTESSNASVAGLWAAFLGSLPTVERERVKLRGHTAQYFCSNEADANELGRLVLAGRKRATASSLRACKAEGEALPSVGDYSVVTDWQGTALCVIETTRLELKPFGKVDEAFAAREREGDGSLGYWRDCHERFFSAEHAVLAISFDLGSPVLCEDFRVVWPESGRSTAH